MALPIDLQVLISKAPELGDNIARQINATQSGMIEGYEKDRQASLTTDETVSKTEETEESFTKINSQSERKNRRQFKKKPSGETASGQAPSAYRPAPKEEGTGRIIDIVD